MEHNLGRLASEWHQALPGIGRAFLLDHGLSQQIIDRHLIGWDENRFTMPIPNAHGRFVFFETWNPETIGIPVEQAESIELFGHDVLARSSERVLIAEGVFEALLLRSAGFNAVSATDSGRYFKAREWTALFRNASEVLVAFKNGPQRERRKWMLDRDEVVEKILGAVPQATSVHWPPEVGPAGGAFEFFVHGRRTKAELEALWANR